MEMLSHQSGVSYPQISTHSQCKHWRHCSFFPPKRCFKKEHFISEHNVAIFHVTVLIFPDIMSAPAPHYEDNDPLPKAGRISPGAV